MTSEGGGATVRSARETAQTWGGTALIIGGIALAAAYVSHPAESSPEAIASMSWILIHVGFLVSLIAGILGVTALLGRYLRAGGGLTGLIGYIMAVISMVLVAGLDYSEIFIFPTLAVEYPDVVLRYGDGTAMPSVAFAFPATGVLFVAGFVVFSYQLFKARVSSPTASFTTLIGTLVFGVGLSGFVPFAVVKTGAVLFGLGLVLLGREILVDPTA